MEYTIKDVLPQLRGMVILYGPRLVNQALEKILYDLILDLQEMKKEDIFKIEVPKEEFKEVNQIELPKEIVMVNEIPTMKIDRTPEAMSFNFEIQENPRRARKSKKKSSVETPQNQENGIQETPQNQENLGNKTHQIQENLSNKEKKKIHSDIILKKRQSLESENKRAISLLTEENMKEWISKNMSYWKIAELTGCYDSEVSQKAKEYGLKSTISRIIAGKKMKTQAE